jgi:hypothetical protein
MVIVAASVMTSCEEVDGKQTPIKLDKSELIFSSVGGEQTVTAVNYNNWWISGGYEDFDQAKNEYTNYVYPTSTDGEDVCTYDLLDGGWYYVVVPDKGNSNQVVITVSDNTTSKPRSATIIMQNRNAFTNISIQQE